MPAQPRRYQQGKYWLITAKSHLFIPHLPRGVIYAKGQLERGNETGFEHWQMLFCYEKKVRLATVKSYFIENVHAELSNSSAANDYVWKEDTRVENTQFELGKTPFKRNCKTDWEDVWKNAKEGNIEAIPANVRVQSYTALKRIEKDHMRPQPIEREVKVFVGPTGTGKSRRAWLEAGNDAYPKDPCSKFWDGYSGQEHVVIDEFRGQIGISHVLRWFDRYPVCIESKGSGSVLHARKLWITSNLQPQQWYPDLDDETKAALIRRLNIEEMLTPYFEDIEN